jgi:hypothetical protein
VQATHDAMMKVFERTLNPLAARDDAGSGDGLEETPLHRQEVALPGGGRLIVSDLEEITADRLDETAEVIAEILQRKAEDRR